MKRHSLKIYLVLIASFAVFMAMNAFTGRAQDAAAEPTDYCSVKSDYNDPNLDTEQVMEKYHKKINEEFNKYTARMIEAETLAAKTGQREDAGRPPKPVSENEPQVLQACTSDNYSTYCVGQTLLTNEQYGYIAYIRALDCKRNKIYDSTQAEKSQFTSQGQAALMMSARLEAIAREKTAAKRALDQTLSAYNELRMAWPMHKSYMKIYESLIKYRDKLVEIRNQVEEFPSKFIDASTTKCT
jgi:hypothetical protein